MRHLLLSILTLSATSIARNKWLKRSKGLRGLTKPLRLQLFSTDSSANMEWDAITGTWKNDKAAGTDNLPNPLYIFGYGSLIWKPSDVLENFSVFKSMCLGHRRTFFQRSMDHRGTPSFPGLVANLVDDQLLETSGWRLPHEEPSTCMGVSYLIPSDNIISVIAELDYRERGGYSRHLIPVKFIEDTPFHKAGEIVQVLVYTGLQKNPNFYLPILTNMIHYQYCLLKLSNIIAFAHGPSGANADYLINLTTYLRKSKISDDHLYELTRLVQNRLDRLPIPASKTDFCLIGWGSNEHGK
jgi:cation transport protein ChaC